MVLGRLKDAAADVAETLRRAFTDPPCGRLDPVLPNPRPRVVPILEARGLAPEFRAQAPLREAPLEFAPEPRVAALDMSAPVRAEEGWSRWAAGAPTFAMEVFRVGAAPRVAVPPLPRRPEVKEARPGLPATRSRSLIDPLIAPGTRQLRPAFLPPRCREALDMALGLPVAVTPEAQALIPKALWMRYTLQLVKATDANIRSLDILGLYRIPARGVRGLRHDAASGRLLLDLGPEASGAPRSRLMLARTKTDRALVSCFLEDE